MGVNGRTVLGRWNSIHRQADLSVPTDPAESWAADPFGRYAARHERARRVDEQRVERWYNVLGPAHLSRTFRSSSDAASVVQWVRIASHRTRLGQYNLRTGRFARPSHPGDVPERRVRRADRASRPGADACYRKRDSVERQRGR